MKNFLRSNIWLFALALCLLTFISYRAIETGNCVEADMKSFRAGACQNN